MAWRVAGPGSVAVAPQLIGPVGDRPVLVDAGFDVGEHGRAERLPGQLVGAAPERPYVPAGNPHRQQRGVHGNVVCGIVAVAAGALDVLHDDGIGRQFQGRRNGTAQREHTLAVAPHVEASVVVFRDGTAWADRCVRKEGPREGGVHHGRRIVVPGGVIADQAGLGLCASQPPGQVIAIGQLHARRPRRCGRQSLGRLGGLPLTPWRGRQGSHRRARHPRHRAWTKPGRDRHLRDAPPALGAARPWREACRRSPGRG